MFWQEYEKAEIAGGFQFVFDNCFACSEIKEQQKQIGYS
jgi:hypothetical protein